MSPNDSAAPVMNRGPASPAQQPHSRIYLSYVLGMAFVLNVLNIADRQILGIVLEPIKQEFLLTDLHLGLLSGLVFTLIYTTLGIPIGSLADRTVRRNLVAGCLALWSAMTVTCGFAMSYTQLLLSRMGVALGEAGFSPSIQSMLSDYFAPSRRATVLAIWGLGAPIGGMLGHALGGYMAEHFGWRSAFLTLGLPGLVLAVLFWATVREPVRGASEQRRDDGHAASIGSAIAFAWKTRSFRYLMFGAGTHLLVFYGLGIWLAPFYVRSHELSLSQAGLYIGLITGLCGGLGTLLGGWLSDRLGRTDARWYAWVTALSLLGMMPFAFGMYLANSVSSSLVFGGFVGFLGALWLAPTFAIVQLVAPLRMRGVSVGILHFTQVMIGFGIGPTLVGFLSDQFEPSFGKEALRWALVAVFLVEPLAVFLYYKAGRALPSDLQQLRAA